MKFLPLLLAVALPAQASSPCSYFDLLSARFNPLGLSHELYLRCERPLYRSATPALATNFVALVPGLALSPASLRPSIALEVQPASVFNLFVAYQPTLWYGWLGSLQSFPSVHSNWGSSLLGSPDSPNGPSTQLIHQFVLGGTLQARVGPFAARSVTRFSYFRATVHGDPVFYDPRADLLTPARGWTVEEETVVTWSPGAALVLGLDLTYEHAFYPGTAYRPEEPRDNPNSQTRLGPLLLYTPFEHQPGALLDAPSFFVLLSFYLDHRYRAGANVSQAIPYLAAGLSFKGDL